MLKDLMKTESNPSLDFDRRHIWHPFTSLEEETAPVYITSAQGVYLYTEDGRKIIDAISSWWVNIHGHSNSRIAEAIYKQATTLEHVIFAGFTHEPAITLCKNLLTILPANQTRMFFSDNGSTAVEVGLKMAIQYWHNKNLKKTRIIAIEGAYHGDTFGSMSVGGRTAFTSAFEPFLFDVEFIEVPTAENIEHVLDSFRAVAEKGDVAAFVFEPLVQGAAGMVMYEPEHLDALLSIAHSYEIVCIADEVFTGFGRTGKLFASEYLHETVDIMAISKGITGGTLPLGVTACCKRIEDAFHYESPLMTFFHGHSYTANPISCAAANASFAILTEETTRKNIARIEEQHMSFIERIKFHRSVKNARCRGTIMAVELVTPEKTSYFNSVKKMIYTFFMERDILLRPLGNVVYILPPYIITNEELERIYSAITEFLCYMEKLPVSGERID